MTHVERRLCIAGAVLFLFGLGLGFGLPAFADRQALLGAHVTALGSGTFLIVMGVIWHKLSFSPKSSNVFAHLLWISFYILQAGLTLAATSLRAAADAPQSTSQMIAGLLNIVGALLMTVAVIAVVVGMMKAKVNER